MVPQALALAQPQRIAGGLLLARRIAGGLLLAQRVAGVSAVTLTGFVSLPSEELLTALGFVDALRKVVVVAVWRGWGWA